MAREIAGLSDKDVHVYRVEDPMKLERLIDAGVPVLGIETDYTDQDAEQLKTRIGAFLEMLGS